MSSSGLRSGLSWPRVIPHESTAKATFNTPCELLSWEGVSGKEALYEVLYESCIGINPPPPGEGVENFLWGVMNSCRHFNLYFQSINQFVEK